jgi:hypothetical protein
MAESTTDLKNSPTSFFPNDTVTRFFKNGNITLKKIKQKRKIIKPSEQLQNIIE